MGIFYDTLIEGPRISFKSPTEQMALVGKFGSQIQSTITSRFDRVETTPSRMAQFLDLQKPLFRLDIYVELTEDSTSEVLGRETLYFTIADLQDLMKEDHVLFWNLVEHPSASQKLVLSTALWLPEQKDEPVQFLPSLGGNSKLMRAFAEISITQLGRRLALSDVTAVRLSACCTAGLRNRIRRIAVDLNGYEAFVGDAKGEGELRPEELPKDLQSVWGGRQWTRLITTQTRSTPFEPFRRSPRFSRLARIEPPS